MHIKLNLQGRDVQNNLLSANNAFLFVFLVLYNPLNKILIFF